jgi:hypothetical protein
MSCSRYWSRMWSVFLSSVTLTSTVITTPNSTVLSFAASRWTIAPYDFHYSVRSHVWCVLWSTIRRLGSLNLVLTSARSSKCVDWLAHMVRQVEWGNLVFLTEFISSWTTVHHFFRFSDHRSSSQWWTNAKFSPRERWWKTPFCTDNAHSNTDHSRKMNSSLTTIWSHSLSELNSYWYEGPVGSRFISDFAERTFHDLAFIYCQ